MTVPDAGGGGEDADEAGAEGASDFVQDDDGAQASGTFGQVVRIQSVHVPGDQRQFLILLLLRWGFGCGGRTGSSQVYTAGLDNTVFALT